MGILRTPDYLSVFSAELTAIVLALHWLGETQIKKEFYAQIHCVEQYSV